MQTGVYRASQQKQRDASAFCAHNGWQRTGKGTRTERMAKCRRQCMVGTGACGQCVV
jgi:hypothetical protein